MQVSSDSTVNKKYFLKSSILSLVLRLLTLCKSSYRNVTSVNRLLVAKAIHLLTKSKKF